MCVMCVMTSASVLVWGHFDCKAGPTVALMWLCVFLIAVCETLVIGHFSRAVVLLHVWMITFKQKTFNLDAWWCDASPSPSPCLGHVRRPKCKVTCGIWSFLAVDAHYKVMHIFWITRQQYPVCMLLKWSMWPHVQAFLMYLCHLLAKKMLCFMSTVICTNCAVLKVFVICWLLLTAVDHVLVIVDTCQWYVNVDWTNVIMCCCQAQQKIAWQVFTDWSCR